MCVCVCVRVCVCVCVCVCVSINSLDKEGAQLTFISYLTRTVSLIIRISTETWCDEVINNSHTCVIK